MRSLFIGLFILLISFVEVQAELSSQQTYERGLNLLKNGYNKEAIQHFSLIIDKNANGLVCSSYINRAQA